MRLLYWRKDLKIGYIHLVSCFLCVVIITSSFSLASSQTGLRISSESPQMLEWELEEGEAIFWYLSYAGWMIKTKNHLLVIDYMEPNLPPEEQKLSNGFIAPETLAGYDVSLFATHNHGDHWDPESLEWIKVIPKIRIVLNWPAATGSNILVLNDTLSHLTLSDLEIYSYTLRSSFNIPHSTILIKVDGVSFYTNDDFGARGNIVPDYVKQCIDYISSTGDLDILLLNMSGNIDDEGEHFMGLVDAYTVMKLNPKVVFPQHRIYSISQRNKVLREAEGYNLRAQFIFTDKAGQAFHLKKGVVKMMSP